MSGAQAGGWRRCGLGRGDQSHEQTGKAAPEISEYDDDSATRYDRILGSEATRRRGNKTDQTQKLCARSQTKQRDSSGANVVLDEQKCRYSEGGDLTDGATTPHSHLDACTPS
jgi:hypothetical protein